VIPVVNTVTAPAGVTYPTWLPNRSANQTFPSGPTATSVGAEVPDDGTG